MVVLPFLAAMTFHSISSAVRGAVRIPILSMFSSFEAKKRGWLEPPPWRFSSSRQTGERFLVVDASAVPTMTLKSHGPCSQGARVGETPGGLKSRSLYYL